MVSAKAGGVAAFIAIQGLGRIWRMSPHPIAKSELPQSWTSFFFGNRMETLFSFYYRLLSERAKINPNHWLKTYGPIIRRIDTDIAIQFPADKVETARFKAQQDPHPTWKGPIL